MVALSKKTRLSVLISNKQSDLISEYQSFHKEVSGEAATLDSLVAAFISAALMSDKNFLTWRKKANRSADSAIDSTEDEFETETENLRTENFRSPADDFEVEIEGTALERNLTDTQSLNVESDSTVSQNEDFDDNLFEITSSN